MRIFSEEVYGIARNQVIGSHGEVKFSLNDKGEPVLTKSLDPLFIHDGPGKAAGIHRFLGRKPIACFGNSDGDEAMLQLTTINNSYRSLGAIVHHTDGERDYAYDRNPRGSGGLDTALDAATDQGWLLIDMKTDWEVVFPE